MNSKRIILASIATSLSIFSSSVFAMDTTDSMMMKSDSMMKTDAMAQSDTMMKADTMMKSDSMMKNDAMMKTDTMMMKKTLKVGSSGAEVITLQTALETAGYLKIPKGIRKGYFGPLTRAALKSFQKANKMAQTGIYDAKTMAKLEAAVAMKMEVMAK